MFSPSLFAERLNELFFDNKTNVLDVAKKTEIPKSTLYRYLNAETIPSMEMLIKLADIFNCSVDYLAGLEPESYRYAFIKCPPFSERFRFLLHKYKISKYRLHKELGLSNTSLYTWQNGNRNPSIDSLMLLSVFLNRSVDFLIGRED